MKTTMKKIVLGAAAAAMAMSAIGITASPATAIMKTSRQK